MRRFSIPALLGMLFFLAPALRADEGEANLQKVLREVEALRQIVEKEARARAVETRALREALDEARHDLLKAHDQNVELAAKLAATEAEVQRLAKNAAIEKFAAEIERTEPSPIRELPPIKPEPRPLAEAKIDRPEPRPAEEIPAQKPGIEVHGKITSVSDSGLYLLSIGASDGLKQGDVVEVIHPGETPKPLGTLTLVRAYAKQSIGEFKAIGIGRPEAGDEVTARIPAK